MKYLKKYVKFRKEDGYILLCDCSTMQNYELPLSMIDILEKLHKGYDIYDNSILETEKELIEDLINLNLLDDEFNSNKGFHEQKWIKLDYKESEFYND